MFQYELINSYLMGVLYKHLGVGKKLPIKTALNDSYEDNNDNQGQEKKSCDILFKKNKSCDISFKKTTSSGTCAERLMLNSNYSTNRIT